MQKFLLWCRDVKHTQDRTGLSVARVSEFIPEEMIVQISAVVRGRRAWTAWEKYGKEVVLEWVLKGGRIWIGREEQRIPAWRGHIS